LSKIAGPKIADGIVPYIVNNLIHET